MRYLGLFIFITSTLSTPTPGTVTHHGSSKAGSASKYSQSIQEERAAAVQEAFEFAWNGYYRYAFPNDELHPISNGYGNSR